MEELKQLAQDKKLVVLKAAKPLPHNMLLTLQVGPNVSFLLFF